VCLFSEGLVTGGSFTFQKWFGLNLEGNLRLKLQRQKECEYKGEEINFLAKYHLHPPKKYQHSIMNARDKAMTVRLDL